MTAPRFFVPRKLDGSVAGRAVSLPDSVAHHALRVLRLADGAPITLFDGTGGEYRARLSRAGKRDAEAIVEAFDPVERESPLAVTLVQSLLASDAMDLVVRKSVELGVASIVPAIADRSQRVGAGERVERRLAHWRSIIVAACEQCGRNRIPAIAPPISLDAWLKSAAGRCALAWPDADESLAAYASRTPPDAIVVGPEGGFIEAELALAASRGLARVHLGRRVLKAETAGIAALATLLAIAGDAR